MILYPRGLGGNWLSNLIWHLEHGDFSLPRVNVVFDAQRRCSIPIWHGTNDHSTGFAPKQSNHCLFSCTQLFHHYLNNTVKVKYHIQKLDQLPWPQRLFEISNGARYYLSSKEYSNYYCDNIDLDYSRIFVDPDQFVTDLFALLNKLDLNYTHNRSYALDSIAYYRTTCPDPADHFDNFNSELWLGCCHAIALLDNLDINEPVVDVKSAQRLLQPYAEHCANRIKPLMFEWKI